VWIMFMLPYVAIGLHIRHVLPISCALVLMAFLGIDSLAAQLRWLVFAVRHPGKNPPLRRTFSIRPAFK